MPHAAATSSPAASAAPVVVALVGNPNTGKSTLFTALAGIPTRIGNYPGVTVEEKVGRFRRRDQTIELIDLPGAYSLVPKSPDEEVAVRVLHGQMKGVAKPAVVVVVADATNIVRNLYLASQVIEVGLPTIIALTLTDLAARKGITIDVEQLSARLGCPVVPVVAPAREGIDQLGDAILAAAGAAAPPRPDIAPHLAAVDSSYPPPARDAIARYAWIDGLVEGVTDKNNKLPTSLNL
jgi:ferrous iron transport protein B